MSLQKKILVATDASKYASEIINIVASMNWLDGTKIHLLTVVETTHNWDSQEQYTKQCMSIQSNNLVLLQAALPKCFITAQCIEGHADEVILAKAIEENFDLIVIGSHGDTGVRPGRVGSIAARIVNSSPCSVSLVKVGRAELKSKEKEKSGSVPMFK